MAKQELIVYVNLDGTPTGQTAPKLEAHNANTKLHLGFSCYIFNDRGQILVTKRAASKKVWPSVWTNSVCGHPQPDELVQDAVKRRAKYELGLQIKHLKLILPTYRYKTPSFQGVIENEFCPVYIALATNQPRPNAKEVADYKWMEWAQFMQECLKDKTNEWSWWCKDQVGQLNTRLDVTAFINR